MEPVGMSSQDVTDAQKGLEQTDQPLAGDAAAAEPWRRVSNLLLHSRVRVREAAATPLAEQT